MVLAICTLLSPLSLPGTALLPGGYFSHVCLAHPNPSPFTGPCLFASCSHAHTGASYRGSTCGINFPCSIPYPCLFAYTVLSYALEASLPFRAKKDKGQAGVGEEEGRYQVRILSGEKKKKSNLCLNYSTFLGICLFAEREQVWEWEMCTHTPNCKHTHTHTHRWAFRELYELLNQRCRDRA